MSVIERIYDIIHNQRITQAEFCNKTGLHQSTLSATKTRRGGVGEDLIAAVVVGYPTLNAKWLLIGEGEMWLNDPNNGESIAVQQKQPVTNLSSYIELEKEVLVLRERVLGMEREKVAQNKEIELLREIVEMLKKK